MIYQYEHFNPPFEDCKSHNPEGITLLCGSCHNKKTRMFLPLTEVIKANSDPYSKRDYCWNKLCFNSTPPTIVLGNNHSYFFKDIIIINDKKILSVDPPEIPNSPYQITASFFNEESNPILNINRNTIAGKPSDVDILVKGGTITIKKKSQTLLHLSLKNQP